MADGPAAARPRLGIHLDYRFRQSGGRVSAERAFALFAFALAEHTGGLTLIGRLEPEGEPYPYVLPADVGFAPLPFYASLARPAAALLALPRTMAAFWRALD